MFWKFLGRVLDRVRKPERVTLEEILNKMGISESDEIYEKLHLDLELLIKRKSREKDFIQFFDLLGGLLYKKYNSELSKKNLEIIDRNETIQKLNEDINQSREQLIVEIVLKVFSKKVVAILDRPTFQILHILFKNSVSEKSLKNRLNIKNHELHWRLSYLKGLGLVRSDYTNNNVKYSLSNVGITIFETHGREFEKLIDLYLKDKAYQLSLKAVNRDFTMAKRLKKWIQSHKARGHMDQIRKLQKKFTKPRLISQAFFSKKEQGITHEKHIGVRITDHHASGTLLLLELDNFDYKNSYN
ncbi:MAG: hypothetical protein ACFFAU_14240 [Candidatus Hodarchaeota archaeon]